MLGKAPDPCVNPAVARQRLDGSRPRSRPRLAVTAALVLSCAAFGGLASASSASADGSVVGTLDQLATQATQPLAEATHTVADALPSSTASVPAAGEAAQAAATVPQATVANAAAKLGDERSIAHAAAPVARALDRATPSPQSAPSGETRRVSAPSGAATPLLGRVTRTVEHVERAAGVHAGVAGTARGLVSAPARTVASGAEHVVHGLLHAAQSPAGSPQLGEAASLVHRQLATVLALTAGLRATIVQALPTTARSLVSPLLDSVTGTRTRMSLVQPEPEESAPATPTSSTAALLARGDGALALAAIASPPMQHSGSPGNPAPINSPAGPAPNAPTPGGLLPVAASSAGGSSVALALALIALLLAACRPALRRLRDACEALRPAQFLLIPERPG